MAVGASILGILLSLVFAAVGVVVMYFVVKAAVKNGMLEALDDPRATVGAHRVITQLRGGGQVQPAPQQLPGQQQPGQYPPQ